MRQDRVVVILGTAVTSAQPIRTKTATSGSAKRPSGCTAQKRFLFANRLQNHFSYLHYDNLFSPHHHTGPQQQWFHFDLATEKALYAERLLDDRWKRLRELVLRRDARRCRSAAQHPICRFTIDNTTPDRTDDGLPHGNTPLAFSSPTVRPVTTMVIAETEKHPRSNSSLIQIPN